MTTTTELAAVVLDLHAHAQAHPFNILRMELPKYANFEHEGQVYRVALSHLLLPVGMTLAPDGSQVPPGKKVYMLTVCQLNSVANNEGAYLPTEEDGAEIAKAFFPDGWKVVPERMDIAKLSLKYFALL